MTSKIYYKNGVFSLLILLSITLAINLSFQKRISIVKFVQAQATPSIITVCPENLEDIAGCQFFGAIGIQKAINYSADGDKIIIKEGIYTPFKTIEILHKKLTIEGEGHRRTIIKGIDLPEHSSGILDIQASEINLGKLQISEHQQESGDGLFINSAAINLYGLEITNNKYNGIIISSLSKSVIKLTNSLIHGNSIGIQIVRTADMEIINNVIVDNHDEIYVSQGVGIWINHLYNGQSIVIKNNIIANNGFTGGVLDGNYGGEIGNSIDKVHLNRNILWNNKQNYIGINPGDSDLLVDPKFTSSTDYHLSSDSPGINTGDPLILDPDGSRSDIGAYGGPESCNLDPTLIGCLQRPTSIPTSFPSNCPTKSQGDTNCDGKIDEADYEIWKCEFMGEGKCLKFSSEKAADFNNDNNINLTDFEIWRRSFYK